MSEVQKSVLLPFDKYERLKQIVSLYKYNSTTQHEDGSEQNKTPTTTIQVRLFCHIGRSRACTHLNVTVMFNAKCRCTLTPNLGIISDTVTSERVMT